MKMGTLLIKESGDHSPKRFLRQILCLAIQRGNSSILGALPNPILMDEIYNLLFILDFLIN